MSTARFYDKQSLCRAIVLDYQPDHEEGEDPGQWKKRREQRFIPTFLRIMGKERAGSLDQAKSIEELGKQPSYVKFLWLMQARKRLSEEAFLRQLSRISGKSFGRMPSEEELRKIGERFFRGWVDDTCRNLRVRAEENGPGTGYGDDVRLVKEFEAYLRRMESAEEAEEETGEDDEVIGEEDLSESGAALFAGRRTYTGAYRNGGSGERNGEDYIEAVSGFLIRSGRIRIPYRRCSLSVLMKNRGSVSG